MNPSAYITLVRAKRALGASWGAISGMTGVSVPDLRKAFDPTWPKEFTTALQPLPQATKRTAAAPPAPKRKTLSAARPGTLIRRILLAINAGSVTTVDIAKATGATQGVVAVLLTRLKGGGLVAGSGSHLRFVWSLTEKADALLSGLSADEAVRDAA